MIGNTGSAKRGSTSSIYPTDFGVEARDGTSLIGFCAEAVVIINDDSLCGSSFILDNGIALRIIRTQARHMIRYTIGCRNLTLTGPSRDLVGVGLLIDIHYSCSLEETDPIALDP